MRGYDAAVTRGRSVRPYETAITLITGDVYVQGGLHGDERAELLTKDDEAVALPFSTAAIHPEAPKNFDLGDGRIFGIDTEGRLYLILDGLLRLRVRGQLDVGVGGPAAGAVMYAPHRILVFGGHSTRTVSIDTSAKSPVVREVAPMHRHTPRVMGTLLADGRILAVGSHGGSRSTPEGLSLEIWDPDTEKWSKAEGWVVRPLHGQAERLDDGSYLVDPEGKDRAFRLAAPVPRGANPPRIESLRPTGAAPGDVVSLTTPDAHNVVRVTAVKTGGTRTWDLVEQRFAELEFAHGDGELNITIPADPTILSPGTYAVTLFDGRGLASSPKMIDIAPHRSHGHAYGPVFGREAGRFFNQRLERVQGVIVTLGAGLESVEPVDRAVTPDHVDHDGATVISFRLGGDDDVVALFGTYRSVITSVGFETVTGNTIGPFGHTDGVPFEIRAPHGTVMSGLRGYAGPGKAVSAIGMNVRDIDDRPDDGFDATENGHDIALGAAGEEGAWADGMDAAVPSN